MRGRQVAAARGGGRPGKTKKQMWGRKGAPGLPLACCGSGGGANHVGIVGGLLGEMMMAGGLGFPSTPPSILGDIGDLGEIMGSPVRGAPPPSSGPGKFVSQTMMMSSAQSADGKMHVEKFGSSTVGDTAHQLQETWQGYSNSSTGEDKTALERRFKDASLLQLKKRNRITKEDNETETLSKIAEERKGDFEKEWARQAKQHLPPHPGGGRRGLAGEKPAFLEDAYR